MHILLIWSDIKCWSHSEPTLKTGGVFIMQMQTSVFVCKSRVWLFEHDKCMHCVTLEGTRDKEEPCNSGIPSRNTLWFICHILKPFQRVPDLWRGDAGGGVQPQFEMIQSLFVAAQLNSAKLGCPPQYSCGSHLQEQTFLSSGHSYVSHSLEST